MIDIFGAAPRTTWKQTLLLLQRKGTLSALQSFETVKSSVRSADKACIRCGCANGGFRSFDETVDVVTSN